MKLQSMISKLSNGQGILSLKAGYGSDKREEAELFMQK